MKIQKILLTSLAVIICFAMSACTAEKNSSSIEANSATKDEANSKDDNVNIKKQIKVTDINNNEVVFELNDSNASRDLYEQLPLEIDVENYSNNEKIFYPEELSTEDTPLAQNKIGTLAYYAPWKDVVMFFGEFRANNSLYELGHVLSGEEQIPNLSGKIKIEKVN